VSQISWFVVQTQARSEEKARHHLANQGFTIYLPRYRRRIRHARRSETVHRPLFPGYLFVRFDLGATRWRAINGTVGVHHILTNGELPQRVPEAIVQEIKAREDETGAVTLLPSSLAPGQPVRLIDGPLAEVSGLFEEAQDDKRIVLLFTLLGREVRAVVPAAAVAAA
jgi:transcriptional antiterminator RfaH